MANLRDKLLHLAARNHFLFGADNIPDKFRRAAVLILFWQQDGATYTLLTERAAHLRSFAGQLCFPGGRVDVGETFEQAALRETEEEVGIPASSVEIMGRLDDAWSGGGYLMVPYVGFLATPPAPVANEEVAKLIPLRLGDDLDISEETRDIHGIEVTEPVIVQDGNRIFGLTADLLKEALEALDGEHHQRGKMRLHYLRHFQRLDSN